MKEQIKEDIDTGAIDSGMGCESVMGAFMDIETITSIEIDGRMFVESEWDNEFFGDLTEKEQDFLLESSNVF